MPGRWDVVRTGERVPLLRQFPGRRIFGYREFASFADIESEFRECDIAFFLSTQIASLPDGLADLAVNISSLHEMRPEQIAFYFSQFDRLLKDGGRFYFKQWKRALVPLRPVMLERIAAMLLGSARWCR